MDDLNMEAERADFEAWADSKGILPHARAARWAGWEERARRAAPTVGDDGLPPLPDTLSARLAPNIKLPIGTHLMNADEAKAMFAYVLAAAPSPQQGKEGA